MKKFISFEKLSKKKQKEENSKHRHGWCSINPVTRKSPNPKIYNRRKNKQSVECNLEDKY